MDSSTSTPFQMSREELYSFHSMDRRLYSILVLDLARDSIQSMRVLALWLWLEKVGYSKVAKKILSLPHTFINELADEAVMCIKCMSLVPFLGASNPDSNENLMLNSVVDMEISLQFFYTNWFTGIEGIDKIFNQVCIPAFQDINEVRRNIGQRTVETGGGMVQPNSPNNHMLIQRAAGPSGLAGLGVCRDGVNYGMTLPNSSNSHMLIQQAAGPSGAGGLDVCTDGVNYGMTQPNSSNDLSINRQAAGSSGAEGFGVCTDSVNYGMTLPNSSNDLLFLQQAAGSSGERGPGVSDGVNRGLVLPSNSSNVQFFSQPAGPSGVRGLGSSDVVHHGMMLPNSSNVSFFHQQTPGPPGARRIVFGDFENLDPTALPNLPNVQFFNQQVAGPSRAQELGVIAGQKHGMVLLPNSSNPHLFNQQAAALSGYGGLASSGNVENYYYAPNHRNADEVDKRTLFVTFSKGYPVYEVELIEFFTRAFGECIESLYMQDVTPDRQPLFARIVFLHASTVELVLNGGVTKAKFNINGKHVWARRFVPKRSVAADFSANPTPHLVEYWN